jgi:hypothetical protein
MLMLSISVQSSPGAHGPNGEHLNMEQKNQHTLRPKFEVFTGSFELLGEVFSNELIVYLHDFETNTPIQFANIELETGAFVASARYDETQIRYIVNDVNFAAALNTAGEHEVIVTILTKDNGDLLVANFVMPEDHVKSGTTEDPHDGDHSHGSEHAGDQQYGEEHHHFPWWALGLAIVVFGLGFLLGRKNKGVKS